MSIHFNLVRLVMVDSILRICGAKSALKALINPMVVLSVAVVAIALSTPAGAILPDPGESVDNVEQPGQDDPPLAPLVEITDRTSDTLTVRWSDRTQYEQGYRLQRRSGLSGPWEPIATTGARSGAVVHEDPDLSPDSRYCYRVEAYNFNGSNLSEFRCAFTQDGKDNQVWRLQLRLETATVEHAETDDRVSVRLTNSAKGTVLSYGRDDFEAGDDFIYDLALDGITEMEDVTRLRIDKMGNRDADGWCVQRLELLVNEVSVFDESFGASTCHWIDGRGTYIEIPHAELRAHPLWNAYEAPGPDETTINLEEGTATGKIIIFREDLESIIEAMVGNLISGSEAYWGHLDGRAVEVKFFQTDMVEVDLDLAGKAELLGLDYLDYLADDPEVDIKFKLRFDVTLNNDGKIAIGVDTIGFSSTVDFDWFTESVLDILPCGPVASIIADEGIPFCGKKLEDLIEERITSSFQQITLDLEFDAPQGCCVDLDLVVTEEADVEINGTVDITPPTWTPVPVGGTHNTHSPMATQPAAPAPVLGPAPKGELLSKPPSSAGTNTGATQREPEADSGAGGR